MWISGPIFEIAYQSDRMKITLGYVDRPENESVFVPYEWIRSVSNPFGKVFNLGDMISIYRDHDGWATDWAMY